MKYTLAVALLILPLYWLILQIVALFVSTASKATQQPSDIPTQFDLY